MRLKQIVSQASLIQQAMLSYGTIAVSMALMVQTATCQSAVQPVHSQMYLQNSQHV